MKNYKVTYYMKDSVNGFSEIDVEYYECELFEKLLAHLQTKTDCTGNQYKLTSIETRLNGGCYVETNGYAIDIDIIKMPKIIKLS